MQMMMMKIWMHARRVTGRAFLVLMVGIFATVSAKAEVRIDITRGVVKPIPLAVTNFHGISGDEAQVGRDISGVITADLERSGLFKPIDSRAFLQTPESLQVQPRFSDWRVISAQALVNGNIKRQADGRLRVEFRLWDVVAESQMTGLAYFTKPDNWRRVSHIIADAIYKRITGESGIFDTRVVYIAESGIQTRRVRRLAIMDQDGANHRFLSTMSLGCIFLISKPGGRKF